MLWYLNLQYIFYVADGISERVTEVVYPQIEALMNSEGF